MHVNTLFGPKVRTPALAALNPDNSAAFIGDHDVKHTLDAMADWSSSAFRSVGAFALGNVSTKDAVLLVTLAPGQYSARVSGTDGGGGTAIVEVYEVP